MNLIKRKISLNTILDLKKGDFLEEKNYVLSKDQCESEKNIAIPSKYNPNPNYGKYKSDFIYFTFPIFENFDNIGIYDTYEFIPSVTLSDEIPDFTVRKSGIPLEEYLTDENYIVKGNTDSRLDEIDYYGTIVIGKNYSNDTYSFTGVIQNNTVKITYVVNGELNSGTYVPNTGIKYEQFYDINRIVFDEITGNFIEIPLVDFSYSGKGWDENNQSLKELVKDDILFGIDEVRQTDNELQIDRGNYSVFENHYILGEVNTLEDTINYRNNYFKL